MLLTVAIIYGICLLLTAVNEMGLKSACCLALLIISYTVIEKFVDAYKGRKNKKYREKDKTKKETAI